VAIGSYFVCPLIGAVIALVLASSAARELDQYPGQLTGHGLVTASRWLAAVHFAIVGLFIGVVLILVACFASACSGSACTSHRRRRLQCSRRPTRPA
jgi:hypothetical protein